MPSRLNPLPAALLSLSFLLCASPALAQTSAQPCAGQVVRDAVGPVCVPLHPKRIVTIEWTYTENLLALGLQPVGMADIKQFLEYVKAPMPIASSVQDLGQRGAVSLERLAALKPDLIIDASDNGSRAALSRIAPTLVFNPYRPESSGLTSYQEMRQTFTLMGRVTGRDAQARQVLARLDAEVASARRALAASGKAGQTFVLSQGYGGKEPAMRLFSTNSLGSQILEKTGLRNAWVKKSADYGFDTLSLEGLTTLKTQNFFGITAQNDNVYVAPSNLPVWNNLDFVKKGQGYSLAPTTWVFGGPASAQVLIQQVVGAMTQVVGAMTQKR